MKKVISTPKAPAPKGAYSQGVVAAAPQLYVSAQGPIDPETGAVVGETFAGQLERLLNVRIFLPQRTPRVQREARKIFASFASFAVRFTQYARYNTLHEQPNRYSQLFNSVPPGDD
ncbi:MAG TPA: regulator [Anaerolineae bacterium]|nr:regulator [Anaerolineae bacterium]